ncbi:MAG TPA: hypothetical protein PLW68_08005 [Casimicrobiaceae bacterium]|nr:hypothetical protein [Casimicrobiaceae bacterium]
MSESKISFTPDGIVIANFGRFPAIDRKMAESSFRRRLALAKGPRPVMVRVKGAFSATPEVHRFASGDVYGAQTKSMALVGEYAVCKEFLYLFQQIDHPPFPCRYFDNEGDALAWLRTFL